MTRTTLKLISAAALLAGMALAPPAHAQAFSQKMSLACSSLMVYCVYQGNTLLGIFQQPNELNRQIGGTLYTADYNGDGLTVDLALFYRLPNCTGPALIQSGYIGADGVTVVDDAGPPVRAEFDGASLWVAGPAQIIAPTCNICWGIVCNGNPEGVPMPYSANIAPYYSAYGAAAVIETPKLPKSGAVTVK